MKPNPKPNNNAKQNACRRGVALVIVLGVLSVIVILAVSFAITMRTERVAASNASDNVKARQLMDVALTRALLFLHASLTNQIYPLWGTTNSSLRLDPLTGTFDPNWYTDKGLALEDFTNRVQTYWETNGFVPGFLYGEASNHVPQAFWDEAWNSSANHTYWEPVVQPVSDTTQVSRVIGRVAYLVINCSGLLDANFVSATNALPRMYGTNAGEIEISDFMQDISSVAAFDNNRADNFRYETYPHMLNGSGGECWANFFIHSLALPGYCTNFDAAPHERNISTSVFIGGDPAALLAGRSAITNALAQAFTNLTAGQIMLLFSNLLDYAAAPDSQPMGSLQAQSARTMPMINELLITNEFIRLDANNYTARSSFTVEYWNPFPVGTSNFSKRVDFSAFFRPQAGGNAWITNYLSSTVAPLADVSPHNFRVVSSNVFTTLTRDSDLAGQLGMVDVGFTASVYNAGNFEVDRAAGSQSFNFTVPATDGGTTALVWRLECVDPRFNWNANNPTQWQAATVHSLGRINMAATNYWQANPDCDRDAAMYCAGRPMMSQAELSYLAYDQWKTLPMAGTLMLDAFTIETNRYFRGLVNPNSDLPEALAAAFYNMPIGQYAGEPAGLNNRLSWDDAMRLANRIIANGLYTNLSELARQEIWTGFFSDFSRPDLLTNSLVRECFLRDSVRLLNVRQNVFTVLLVAELAGIDGRFAMFGVRQRAVAVVWRDPYANRFRVHFIKLLRD